jgi:hypothetical protein
MNEYQMHILATDRRRQLLAEAERERRARLARSADHRGHSRSHHPLRSLHLLRRRLAAM